LKIELTDRLAGWTGPLQSGLERRCIYGGPGPKPLPAEESVLGEWVSRMRYWYVGLPALEAETYLNGTNWLGVSLSVLMKTPAGERLQVTARALRRLLECPERPARKYLLVECLQAYAPLSEADKVELTSLLQTPPYEGTLTMIKTIYEEGMEKGMEKGTETTQRRSIERLLLRRFKTLSNVVRQRIEVYPAAKLDDLFDMAVDAPSLKYLGLED
jgi:hypothetical protein